MAEWQASSIDGQLGGADHSLVAWAGGQSEVVLAGPPLWEWRYRGNGLAAGVSWLPR